MAITQALILYLIIIISIAIILLLVITYKMSVKNKNILKEVFKLKKDIKKIKQAEKELAGVISGQKDVSSLSLLNDKPNKNIRKKQKLKQKVSSFIDEKITFLNEKIEYFEEFAGKNVLDKVGIGIFLAGIAFFVGFSLEYDWINSTGRVFFGLILASILLLFGYLLRTKFEKFSSVLIGGGFAALIFSVFAAFYQYDIIGLIPSFAMLLFLIGLAVFLSIMYDRSEITILVFLAGFLAPFTVSFDTGDYMILFSYLLLLNIGVVAYDFFKKSLVINLISYASTFLFYALWLILEFTKSNNNVPALGAFIFLTVFYILIFVMMVINNIRENRKFIPMEFSSLIFGTAMYYTAGLTIIHKVGGDYEGLFTGLIGVLNYTYFLILYNRKNYDKNILHLFMALSIMFFGLVIPVQFVGKSITLLWGLQSVLLLFISQKAKISAMKLSSVWLSAGMLISLVFDLYSTYVSTTGDLAAITPVFNKGFLSSMVAIISLSVNLYLLKNEEKPYIVLPFVKINVYKAILGTAALMTFYFAAKFELKYAVIQKVDYQATINTIMGIYNFTFILLFMIPSIFKNMKFLHIVNISLATIGLLLYLFFYNSEFVELRNAYLLSIDVSLLQFNLHYINSIIIFAILILGFRSALKLLPKENALSYLSTFVFIFGVVFLLSSEIDHFFARRLYQPNMLIQDILATTHGLPYTLVWTVSSLLFVIIGFAFKHRGIRFFAIGLYIVSFIKLFAFDYKLLTNQDLMVAFLTMGAVLLLTSFIFQSFASRIKKTANQ